MIKYSFQEFDGIEVCYSLNTNWDYVEVYSVRIWDVEVPLKSLPEELQDAILAEGFKLGDTDWEQVD